MKKLRLILPLVAISLSACTAVGDKYGFFKDEAQSYRKVKQLDEPVVIPQNLSSAGMENYYEVPGGAEANSAADQPPLAPPGSGIQETRTISQQDKIRNAENAKIQGHTSVGGPVPTRMSYSQTWNKVGGILQSANYKIVEKDNSLGTYYVVDTRNSGGKVRKDAPIYQVHVKSAGNTTRVSVSPANPGLQSLFARSLGK